MYRLDNIEYLYGLALIPVLILLYALARIWRKNALKKFGEAGILAQLMPGVSSSKPALRFILFLIAIVFIIFGLVNPQIGSKLEEIKREGSDLMICLDVSNSMKAEDFRPNRLEKAKQAIEKLIDKLNNDRIGIIIFAGEAYVQLPITTDYAAAKLFLENIDCDAVPVQGTVISSAIELAEKSFGTEEGKNRAIVIISDGESHDDDAIAAARAAAEKGTVVHTIGIGSPEGVPIPVYKNKIPAGFKKDKDGSTVVTKLNEGAMEEIASAGNGVYVRATQGEIGLLALQERINKMDKKTFDSKMYTDYEDRFQIFIAVSLLLLLIESLLTERRSIWWARLFEGRSPTLPGRQEGLPKERINKTNKG
jgi:Ca-activated chloride channel family protein